MTSSLSESSEDPTTTPETPIPVPAMASFRADFKFCGYYNGKDMPATKWLKKLDWELEGYAVAGTVPPHRYTQAFGLLLTEDAATWSETHPQAVEILGSDDPDEQSVKAFRSLLVARFPTKSTEVSSISFDTELSELRQQDESLAAYYKRLTVLMQHVGARDRPVKTSTADPPLQMLEAAMLESVMKAFLRGLADPDVRREATRGLATPERSLLGIYNMAEEARRTKAAVQKLDEEERKARENDVLRALVQKTMSKDQLDSLVSSFQTNAGAAKVSPSWNFDALTKLLDRLNREGSPTGTAPPLGPPSILPSDYSSNRPGNYSSYPSRRSPPDRYETSRDASAPRKPATATGPNNYRSTPRDLPDKSRSQNPYINGSMPYSLRTDGPMCVRCGELKAKKDDGHTCIPLPAWEQSYLRELVFDTPAQANFAVAGFGDFDGRSSPWKPSTDPSEAPSSSGTGTWTPSTGSYLSQSNSITYGVPSIYGRAQSDAAEVFYDETSGPGKRPRVEEIPDTPNRQSQQVPEPQQPQVVFQASDSRPRNKAKKRVGKKAEPMPLVGLFDENTGSFDAPMSVRAMLQRTKVEMSWLDLVAWSPSMGRELKRLCTRVTKKREKKKPPPPQQGPQFNPILNQQYAGMPTWAQPPPAMPQTFAPFQQQPQVFVPPYQSAPPVLQQPSEPSQLFQAFQSRQALQPSQASQVSQPLQQPTATPGVDPQSSQSTLGASAVQAQPDAHTRFLSAMAGKEKAFRILATVKADGSDEHALEKRETQVDQGSEMNVVNSAMVTKIKTKLRPLSEVGFKGLTMQTADSFETALEHYVGFDVCVEGLWRSVRCFVSPAIRGRSEEPRLLLGLPWLYSVDAFISIRLSSIRIGDSSIGERVRNITGPELVYHRDHNMIMYPKAIIRPVEAFREPESDSDDDSDESEDDLSDVDDSAF